MTVRPIRAADKEKRKGTPVAHPFRNALNGRGSCPRRAAPAHALLTARKREKYSGSGRFSSFFRPRKLHSLRQIRRRPSRQAARGVHHHWVLRSAACVPPYGGRMPPRALPDYPVPGSGHTIPFCVGIPPRLLMNSRGREASSHAGQTAASRNDPGGSGAQPPRLRFHRVRAYTPFCDGRMPIRAEGSAPIQNAI